MTEAQWCKNAIKFLKKYKRVGKVSDNTWELRKPTKESKMKRITETQVLKIASKLMDKCDGIPTIADIVKVCKGDNELVGKVHLLFVNEIMAISLEK